MAKFVQMQAVCLHCMMQNTC